MSTTKKIMYKSTRSSIRRLEVFKLWFEAKTIDRDGVLEYLLLHRMTSNNNNERFRADIENDPANFKGRIFISDAYHLHEIYNSKLLDTLFIDLPMKKRGSKRELLVDSISGHDDTDLPLRNRPNIEEEKEDEVQEDSEGFKNNSNGDSVISGHEVLQMQAPPEKTFLPLMGPNAGIYMLSSFMAIVHRDSGEALTDDAYVGYAAPCYQHMNITKFLFDDLQFWNDVYCTTDQRFELKVDGLFHSLILDCIVIDDSKSVHVEVNWVMDENNATTDTDIYICGELSIISEGRTSLLLETPPDKANKVSLGQSIPLLKSVFAVPYYADFEFRASLNRPENVDPDFAFYFPTVNNSVPFPNSEIDENEVYSGFDDARQDAASFVIKRSKLYKSKKRIDGSGGYLEVTATIDIQ